MRTAEEIMADAENRSPFSNGTEYELWADEWCYRCAKDKDDSCPILSVAFLGNWPKEWTRRRVEWEINGKSGSYLKVDRCTEFEERRGDGDGPEPEPGPPPVIDGQVDMFEVFAEQIVEAATLPEAVSA